MRDSSLLLSPLSSMKNEVVPAPIQQIVNRQMDAWARGDAAGFASDFAEDAIFVSVRGDHVQGRPAIEANHAFIFNGPYKGTKLTETVDVMRSPAPNVAIAHVSVEVSNVAAFPPGVAASGPGLLRTRLLFVLVAEAGRWSITSAQNTIIVSQPLR